MRAVKLTAQQADGKEMYLYLLTVFSHLFPYCILNIDKVIFVNI